MMMKGEEFDWESPLHMQQTAPDSWAGDGAKGGATALPTAAGGLKIVAYTDTLTVPANEAVEFRMDLLVTPVKTLDTPRHFRRDRYYQYGYNGHSSCQEIAAMGVEVLNLHQGVMLNPYINYRERLKGSHVFACAVSR